LNNILNTNSADAQNLDSARSSQAVQTLRGAKAPGTDPAKISKASRNFESLLIGHWLEQAEKSFASVPGTDPNEQSDSSRDQFMSIACESLAQGLSRGGGFGIAKMIAQKMEAAAASDKHEPEPTKSNTK
jgi:Rod binding domain-containing protein